ncbi:DCC1-like thiol-disulfide oxidoreductase family protein [Prochlorococcus marinus]|uniref:Cell division inhibitor n=1 Tax=Prochlorococcus marinus (strain MIT 9211) TaxID=93059 RepID=A9BC14_PROM4|nr:DCC1-like thiol-disulfide oxidoreductase family protein [Prochlorococcus marinus]ABX09376.1 Hypothetical protein P9211_14451 [Prochlorococcus marinus str. MIT 9211]
MEHKLVFIYDGECPFCNHFAELLELKSNLPNISFLNGRDYLTKMNNLYAKGYDLDKGAILIKDDEILHGASAISWICSQLKNPSDTMLEIIRAVFSSPKRTFFLFPILIWSRRVALFLKGVPNKLISKA